MGKDMFNDSFQGRVVLWGPFWLFEFDPSIPTVGKRRVDLSLF